MMQAITTLDGQTALPRYFTQAFAMASRLDNGRLDVVLPDSRRFRVEGPRPGPVGELHVHDPDIFARLIREGDLGFSEAYLDGAWSTPDLQAFMDLIHNDNPALYDVYPGMGLLRAFERLRFWLQSNSKSQARRNIARHYDLGNDFYSRWLDDSMTYSSGLFLTGQETLERAQQQKYAAMCDAIGAEAGQHVLEIGCGWGGFAEYAARERGLRVTALTISREQHAYAVARMARAGLADRVEIKLQDYRDERGIYDGIASIEMIEAVGERYWPVYFTTLRERLRPGGRATVQAILVQDSRFDAYRRGVDFIQKYVFPGGLCPAPTPLRAAARAAGLRVDGSHEFGESYSLTLRRWHETFNAHWDDIAAMGFDERFRRMWNYYLTSCAAAFRTGICDVTQITFSRPETEAGTA